MFIWGKKYKKFETLEESKICVFKKFPQSSLSMKEETQVLFFNK